MFGPAATASEVPVPEAMGDNDDRVAAALDVSAFFDVSLDMLCIHGLDGRLLRLSRSWEAVLGYPLAELEG
jgi:PAS domain-containing protein